MSSYKPPYQVTPDILQLLTKISEILGELRSFRILKPSLVLRKKNSIRTIHGSLAIEGNSLTLDQMTDVLEGKRVVGKSKELQEVKNAIECYEKLSSFNPHSLKSFLAAHQLLMKNLLPKAGNFRSGAVGILKGSIVSHIAPKASMVPGLMAQLFEYLKGSQDLALIKSCVFHYELEFIHPFDDGNGRLGRLWQTIILTKHNPIFEFIPIESEIHKNQADYYRALEFCDKKGDCTDFVSWMLEMIYHSLLEFSKVCLPGVETFESRIEIARQEFKHGKFTRLDYLKLLKTISAPTASRDLARAVKIKKLKQSGKQRLTVYWFAES